MSDEPVADVPGGLDGGRRGKPVHRRRVRLHKRDKERLPTSLPPPEEKHHVKVGLSAREHQMVWLASYGLTNIEIAQILSLSPHTVKTSLQNACYRNNCDNRAHVVAKALRMGWIV